MSREAAKPEAVILDNPVVRWEKRSLLKSLLDGVRSSVRMDWGTLLDVDPDSFPWATDHAEHPIHSGRAAVVRASRTMIGAAGGYGPETQEVVFREQDGNVQVGVRAGQPEKRLFHWDEDAFTVAVYTESNEGRVAMGLEDDGRYAIPPGLVLVELLPHNELASIYQGVHLAR